MAAGSLLPESRIALLFFLFLLPGDNTEYAKKKTRVEERERKVSGNCFGPVILTLGDPWRACGPATAPSRPFPCSFCSRCDMCVPACVRACLSRGNKTTRCCNSARVLSRLHALACTYTIDYDENSLSMLAAFSILNRTIVNRHRSPDKLQRLFRTSLIRVSKSSALARKRTIFHFALIYSINIGFLSSLILVIG